MLRGLQSPQSRRKRSLIVDEGEKYTQVSQAAVFSIDIEQERGVNSKYGIRKVHHYRKFFPAAPSFLRSTLANENTNRQKQEISANKYPPCLNLLKRLQRVLINLLHSIFPQLLIILRTRINLVV
jgi:hypothetical protein